MTFPEPLTINAVDADTGLAVPEVALILVLRARQKNDYSVGPVITDQSGQVRFTRTECERAITRAQQMFIMDYAGDLSSCGPVAEIRLHSPERIAAMIKQYEAAPDFWGRGFDDPHGLFAALRKVRNSDFQPLHVAIKEGDILANPEIRIQLRKK